MIKEEMLAMILAQAEEMHPYKQKGNTDTYCQYKYNEGWCDAIDQIARMLNIKY